RNWKFTKVCPKDVRQFHALDLHIPIREIRPFLPPGNRPPNSRKIHREIHHFGRNLPHYFFRSSIQSRSIAKELNRIAKTVKTADEQSFAVELLTPPQTIRIWITQTANRIALSPCCRKIPAEHVD